MYINLTSILCAWQFMYNFNGSWNIEYPDTTSIYQGFEFQLEDDMRIEITGEFPKVSYFSYQTYDLKNGINIDGIVDYEIVPYNNSNPYNTSQDSKLSSYYKIVVSRNGNSGYQNEIKALNNSDSVILMLRFYGKDPIVKDNANEYWGYTYPPRTFLIQNNTSEELPICKNQHTPYNSVLKEPQNRCNKNFTFIYPTDDNLKYMLPNNDANYMLSCMTWFNKSQIPIAVVSFDVPTISGGLYITPYISEKYTYDIRYISLSTVDRSPPRPVYQTTINIVPKMLISDSIDTIKKCKYTQNINGSFIQLPNVEYPGILYRQILTQSQVVPNASFQHGMADIQNNTYKNILNTMGRYYPRIDYYIYDNGKCDFIYV